MEKQIELNKKKIAYLLKTNRKTRRLSLSIYGDGKIVVTAPPYLSQDKVENFIFEKSRWLLGKLEYFKNFSGLTLGKKSKKDYHNHKKQALNLVKNKLEYFNRFYGLKYQRVSIRNQKTRWGSCSAKGNLNFNYKIVFLPEKLAEYIIAHELCHLKELNHSKNFWNLLAKSIPDYGLIRKELKKIRL